MFKGDGLYHNQYHLSMTWSCMYQYKDLSRLAFVEGKTKVEHDFFGHQAPLELTQIKEAACSRQCSHILEQQIGF